MKQIFINLPSALLGAFVVFVFAVVKERYIEAVRLNRLRRVVLRSIGTVYVNKLERFKSDNTALIRRFQNDPVDLFLHGPGFTVDSMPMLNGELFKSIDPALLFRLCKNEEHFLDLANCGFILNFLKEKMVNQVSREYMESINTHLEHRNLKSEQFKDHINSCTFAASAIRSHIAFLEGKNRNADELIEAFHIISKDLSGNNVNWFFRYLF